MIKRIINSLPKSKRRDGLSLAYESGYNSPRFWSMIDQGEYSQAVQHLEAHTIPGKPLLTELVCDWLWEG